MSTYALRCPAKGCGHTLEVKCRMGVAPERICPKCHAAMMRVVIQAVPRTYGKGGKP